MRIRLRKVGACPAMVQKDLSRFAKFMKLKPVFTYPVPTDSQWAGDQKATTSALYYDFDYEV